MFNGYAMEPLSTSNFTFDEIIFNIDIDIIKNLLYTLGPGSKVWSPVYEV